MPAALWPTASDQQSSQKAYRVEGLTCRHFFFAARIFDEYLG
jgi:hypothetical protein